MPALPACLIIPLIFNDYLILFRVSNVNWDLMRIVFVFIFIHRHFVVLEMTERVESLTEWMTQLPVLIKQIPIINLAIPGIHLNFCLVLIFSKK